MARVYSKFLWSGLSFGVGTYDSSPVPTGFLWVVRDVIVASTIDPLQPVTGFVFQATGGIIMLSPAPHDCVGGRSYRAEMRQVLDEGDVMQFVDLDGGWSWRVSGYELSLP